MAGAFGRTVRQFTTQLFLRNLVHDVASDAHDALQRRPVLGDGFDSIESELAIEQAARDWYTREAPSAIVSGAELPPVPVAPKARRRVLRRLRRGH
jgi:protein-tyrosine phosphatase